MSCTTQECDNVTTLSNLISLSYLSSGCLREVKTQKISKASNAALKVVVVIYERWLLTKDSKL